MPQSHQVIDFNMLDGKPAQEDPAWKFVCETAQDCKELDNLYKVGFAHLKV